MIELTGDRVVLIEATTEDIEKLYYWKFEEKEQEAKKWNGPYIPEEKVSKEEYRTEWEQEIFTDVPAALVIKCEGEAVGYVGPIG